MIVMMYGDTSVPDNRGVEILSRSGNRATNLDRAKHIAEKSAIQHGGRVEEWYDGGLTESSEAIAHSGSIDSMDIPNAHYRIFKVRPTAPVRRTGTIDPFDMPMTA